MNSQLINPDKTKLVVIGVPQLTKRLQPIPLVKLLCGQGPGITIDSSLSYNENVTKTVSNCMHKLVRINRIKHLLDE